MAITVDMVLAIIAVILMVISSFNVASPVDLWKLGWAFAVATLIT